MFAGGFVNVVDTLIIPEVLIGEVDPLREGHLITPTCADAQVFFALNSPSVTATDESNRWLHFGSFLCVFPLARVARKSHNQDPRGIDW